MEEHEITVPEAGRRYGLSPRSILRLHERGLLTLEKRVGQRASLVRVADLERALALRAPRGRPRAATATEPAPAEQRSPLVSLLEELRSHSRRLDGCVADVIRETHDDRDGEC
jgi:hypothetical protein